MADKSIDSVSKISAESDNGTKTIYGQCWIQDNTSLVQDQILILPNGQMCENVVCLIENIWEDLMSNPGKWKCNDKKNYFYWPVTMTDVADDDLQHIVFFECPRPDLTIFPNPEQSQKEAESDWSKYWLDKMVTARENYEQAYAIQKKEVILKGTAWIDQTGNQQVIEDTKFHNPSLGDIENLLSIF